MSRLIMLQKNGITNMVCKNEDCHTPETNCPCTILDQCECPTLKEVVETLAHYKDLEEQGDLVVQKHGHWEILTDEYDCEYMLCTACGGEFYPVDDDTVDSTYNYCPNCGAKMDEVE